MLHSAYFYIFTSIPRSVSRLRMLELYHVIRGIRQFPRLTEHVGIYPNGEFWDAKYRGATWTFVDRQRSQQQAALMYDMLKRITSSRYIIRVNFPNFIPGPVRRFLRGEKGELPVTPRAPPAAPGHPYKTIVSTGGRFKICRRYRAEGCPGYRSLSITRESLGAAVATNLAWHRALGLPDAYLYRIMIINLTEHGLTEMDLKRARSVALSS